jgi:MscS family membrane protein
VGLRYDDSNQLEQIISNVKSMLMTHAEIDNTQTMIVNFNAFGSSSLDFFIYTFTKTTNWIKYHEVKQDVLLQVMRIVADAKAEIAFPTSTVLVSEVPELKAIGFNTVMENSVPNGLRD